MGVSENAVYLHMAIIGKMIIIQWIQGYHIFRETHTGGKEERVSRSSGTFLESYYLFSHTDSLPFCVIYRFIIHRVHR